MKISSKLEDYLEAIYLLEREHSVARIKDVASFLNVKPPTVLSAVRRLADEDLIIHEHYGYIKLTDKGRRYAQQIYRRHKTLLKFFENVLGISKEKALPQACDIEHIITCQTKNTFDKLNRFFEQNPKIFEKWLEEREK